MLSSVVVYLGLVVAGTLAQSSHGSTNQTFVAQEIALISPCGLTCLTKTIPQVGCTLVDTACQCESTQLITLTELCMMSTCTLAETLELGKIQAAICERPYQSRNHFIKVMTVVTSIITYSAVLMRLVSRYALMHKFGMDDWFIMAATISEAIFTYFGARFEAHGFGNHIWDIQISFVPQLLEWFYNCEILYVITIGLVKISILFFYLNVFPKKSFRILVWTTMGFCTCSCIAFTLVTVFQCHPIAFSWDKSIPGGKCVNYNTVAWTNAAINILQDFIIVVLPVHELWHLQLSPKKRIRLFVMFGLGFFVCITSIIRLNSLKHFGLTADPTWDNIPTTFWSTLETCAAILCACLPSIRAGLVHFFPKAFGGSTVQHTAKKSYAPTSEHHTATVTTGPVPSSWPPVELASLSSDEPPRKVYRLSQKSLPPLPLYEVTETGSFDKEDAISTSSLR